MNKNTVLGVILSSALSPVWAGCGGNGLGDSGTGQPGPASSRAAALSFSGQASGSQVVPPTASAAGGAVDLSLDPGQGTLSYHLTSQGAAVTGAQLCHGRAGENGEVLFTLATDGSGTVQLSAGQVAELRAGEDYVVLQSAAFPDGELRAQLSETDAGAVAAGTDHFSAVLSGLQLPRPLAGSGSGSAALTLDGKTGALSYTIQTGLGGAWAVALRRGGFDVTGDVVATLQGGGTLAPTVSGTLMLTAEQQLALKAGGLYLEVTPQGGAGLRGQVLAGGAVPFNVALGPAPLVLTSSTGTAAFFLSADRTQLTYRLGHDLAAATGAAIVKGAGGLDGAGQVVCALSGGQDGAQGSCDVKASGGAGDLLLADLLGGQLQVSVASAAHATGELRGTIQVPGMK